MSHSPRPKKSLGQHFLHDSRAADRIVDMLRVQPDDTVLEIGPGAGALTGRLLAKAPCRLVLIEKDDHWAAHHEQKALEAKNKKSAGRETVLKSVDSETVLEVRHADAMQVEWSALEGPWKIISNLPYNVGSPLIWDIVSRTPQLTRAVFMVQKEVGERLAAVPGTKDYGALSVWVQSYVHVEWGFVVGPGSFSPPPKVDSAVVAFSPLARELCPENPEALSAILKTCFQQRRKQLQSLLRHTGVADAAVLLESLNIAPEARPETLSPVLFQALAKALSQRGDKPTKAENL